MKHKKWTLLLVVLVTCTLLLFATLMYLLDPLVQYGNENRSILTYYEYTEMYSNPGIAKNYEYDSVMVGTSMIQNTDVDLCDELFKCNMVRLPYSGGTTYNMKTILDLCFNSKNEIKSVYWELDEFQLFGNAKEPRYPLPDYLYRADHKDDLSYLLNIDIFYHYTLKDLFNTIKGKMQSAERRGISFTGDFSKEAVLKGYARPALNNEADYNTNSYKSIIADNLQNITCLVENNPETEFSFFLVPFSILYWDREIREGRFDMTVDGLKYAVDELIKYPNVSLYFYHCEKDIITNLDNYKDYSHYGSWINNLITEYIAVGKNRLTEDNYVETVEAFRSFIHEFDFDGFLAG